MSFAQIVRHLIWFELKHSIWYLLLLFGSAIGLLLLTIYDFHIKTSENLISDLSIFPLSFFLIVLILVIRPKVFRTQNLGYNFRVCEHLVHLQQLPLKKSTIVTYRLIVNYVILTPLLIIYLTTLYIVIEPLKQLLPLNHFIVFAIIWLMIAVIILNIQVITDFGTNILYSYIYLFFIFLPIIIAIIAIFNIVIKKSLFELMVFFSTHFPIQSFIISFLVIILSIVISYRWCLIRMSKIDYLL